MVQVLFDSNTVLSFCKVISIRHYLLLKGPRYALPGREPQKSTFISAETGTGMAFNNSCLLFGKSHRSAEIGADLGMRYRMCLSTPDIMEHRPRTHQLTVSYT